jgi:YVTN family beta-propeller protein
MSAEDARMAVPAPPAGAVTPGAVRTASDPREAGHDPHGLHSGTAGATRRMPAQARAAADRIPATRPGTATVYVANAGSDTVTPITIATNKARPAIRTGKNPFAIAITP